MARAKTRTKPNLDEQELLEGVEEDELEEEIYDDEEEAVEAAPSGTVLTDSRARRKRKRGEFVETVADGSRTEKKNRATPSIREQRSRGGVVQVRGFERLMKRIPLLGSLVLGLSEYFRGVSAEMQKVTWPTREETLRLTRMVIAVTLVFSITLGALDLFYGWWFQQALDDSDVMIFLGIGAGVLAVGGLGFWLAFIRQSDTPQPY